MPTSRTWYRDNGPLGPNRDTSVGLSAYVYGNAAGRPDEKSQNVTNAYWGVWKQPPSTDDIDVSVRAIVPVDGLAPVLNANLARRRAGLRMRPAGLRHRA